jgi:excisionase family DNA binding protein
MRQELEAALDLARALALEDLPGFLGELEQIRVVAFARMAAPASEARPDELLDVEQAAKRMHVSEDYLYRHSRRLPFARRVGRKLLFSSLGLDAYLRRAR